MDVTELLDRAAHDALRTYPGLQATLMPSPTVLMLGMPAGLRLVIDNAIANAVKHGGATEIRLSAVSSADDVQIVVDDNGSGVPEVERAEVFERFARGSTASRSGSGLGLALVAQQAELHGGTAALLESPLGGARLLLRLPLPRARIDDAPVLGPALLSSPEPLTGPGSRRGSPRPAPGALHVACGDGLHQPVVRKHAAGGGARGRDAGGDRLQQSPVDLDEHRVVRRPHDGQVELGVGVRELRVVGGVGVRQLGAEFGEVFLGTRGGGQSGALHLEAAADLQHVAQFGSAQPAQCCRYLAGGARVGAVALAYFEDAIVRRGRDGLAHCVAPDAEGLDQFGLGGNPTVDRPFAGGDQGAQLLDDLVDQARASRCGERHWKVLSSNHADVWHHNRVSRTLRNESLNGYEHDLELELDGAVEVRPGTMAAGGVLLVVAVILTALNLRPRHHQQLTGSPALPQSLGASAVWAKRA